MSFSNTRLTGLIETGIVLSLAVILIILSSCLTISPPEEQIGKEVEIKQELFPTQSERVTWKSVRVNKSKAHSTSAQAKKTLEEPGAIDIRPTGMVLIPAGEFLRGSEKSDGDKDETPQHKIRLDVYYIDIYAVTNAQYYQFWIANGSEKSKHTPASYGSSYMIGDWPEVAETKPNYPVVGVTWYDAKAYTEWAGKRLPTEAEWEKAARGTDARIWPWSNDFHLKINGKFIHSNCQHGNDGYDSTTAPVDSYPTGVSPYGVYGMAGNIWEWVADWYEEDYYAHSPEENPKGPDRGKLKVARGGSWNTREYYQRCANRYYCYPDSWGNTLGFRCAKDVR